MPMMELNNCTTVLDSVRFHVSLLHEKLGVVSVSNKHLSKCAWWITRELTTKRRRDDLFTSFIMDDDGLSLICEPQSVAQLKFLMRNDEFTVSPQLWQAFVVNIRGTAYELPGAIYYLANTLSQEGISILHISTYESEVFLVQESNIERACTLLKESENPKLIAEYIERTYGMPRSDASSNSLTQLVSTHENPEDTIHDAEDPVNLDVSWITPTTKIADENESLKSSNATTFREGFSLKVLPRHVILAKVNDGYDLSDFSDIIVSNFNNSLFNY